MRGVAWRGVAWRGVARCGATRRGVAHCVDELQSVLYMTAESIMDRESRTRGARTRFVHLRQSLPFGTAPHRTAPLRTYRSLTGAQL